MRLQPKTLERLCRKIRDLNIVVEEIGGKACIVAEKAQGGQKKPKSKSSNPTPPPGGLCYDDTQWLIIYLLRFIYKSFSYDELWSDPDSVDNERYIADYDEELSLKCANLMQYATTLEVRAAAKLLLTYPLNWQ